MDLESDGLFGFYKCFLSGIVGLRGGRLDQDELLWGRAVIFLEEDEFPIDFKYETEFDGTFSAPTWDWLGTPSTPFLNGNSRHPIFLTTSLQGTVGVENHWFDTEDWVWAEFLLRPAVKVASAPPSGDGKGASCGSGDTAGSSTLHRPQRWQCAPWI
jgi:hypothetical protein